MNKKEAAQRVFGNAFSFESGQTEDPAVEQAYRIEREEATLARDSLVWIARNLEADRGVAADLYFRGMPTLLLDYDFETNRADVYEHAVRGLHDGKLVIDQVPFEDAVEQAEQYLQPRLDIVRRNGQG